MFKDNGWFCLLVFYDTSTLVNYLMLNPVIYIYIYIYMIYERIVCNVIFKWVDARCLLTVKYFQDVLILIILFTIDHLFAQSELFAINHHHHHVVLPARISLTLSRYFSLSCIAFGRSSRLHPVSSHSCCMYVRAGHPAFARPYVGVHRSTLLMSTSLLLQQYPACLIRLTWIVFMMGGWWPYSRCFVGCCPQNLFNVARSILV